MKLFLKYYSLLCFCGLLQYSFLPLALAQTRSPVNIKNSIDSIRIVRADERIHLARTISTSYLRKLDGEKAMAYNDQMDAIAKQLDDKSLQCAILDMRADYYSNHHDEARCLAYYQKALSFARRNQLVLETGILNYKVGMFYFINKNNVQACEYFFRANDQFRLLGYENVREISYYLANEGNFYYSVGDFDKAKTLLETALTYIGNGKEMKMRSKISVINTLGLIYRNDKQYPQAIGQFNKALKLAINNKDTAWIGIARGNIGSVYFNLRQYQTALPYIESDYNLSIKSGELNNGVIALLRLAKISIDNHQLDKATTQLDSSKKILNKSKDDVLEQWTTYYDLRSQLAEKKGDAGDYIVNRKKFEQDNDSLSRRNNISAIEKVKMRWEIDRHLQQLNILKERQKISEIKVDAAIMIVVLLVVVSFLVFRQQQIKTKRDKTLWLAEKNRVDEELKNATSELKQFTENIRQKNALIETFKEEIDRLRSISASQSDTALLENKLMAHLMTDENWAEFKVLFSKVYPGFFINLNKNHQHLSATDTRMLALIKLGLTNAEMAGALGITVEGIKKAKQRLRKKIDIDTVIENEGPTFMAN